MRETAKLGLGQGQVPKCRRSRCADQTGDTSSRTLLEEEDRVPSQRVSGPHLVRQLIGQVRQGWQFRRTKTETAMEGPRRIDATHDPADDTGSDPTEQGRPYHARPQVEGRARSRSQRHTPVAVSSQTRSDSRLAETDLEEDPVPVALSEEQGGQAVSGS